MIDQEHPSDSQLEHLRERYAFADWSDAGTPPESLFIWQYVRNRHDLPGYEIEEIETQPERPASIRAMWRSQSDRAAVLELLVSECPDRSSARPALLRTLGQFQAFLEPRESVGDVAFAAAARRCGHVCHCEPSSSRTHGRRAADTRDRSGPRPRA